LRNVIEIPQAVCPAKAGQTFSIHSSGSHFVQQSRTYLQYAQQCVVLSTPVKFG
jgi:hypothetical protein